jgi:hypothetical protein
MTISNIKFGRKEASNRDYEVKYPFKKLALTSARTVERVLTVPLGLRCFYDQGEMGACVGFSSSWMMSIYNCVPQQKYDAIWLYRQAQLNDNDPASDPSEDTGTYVWAAFWVLQHLGHQKKTEKAPDLNDGVASYYWGSTADDARTAIALGRPFVIGINWYSNMMEPKHMKGERWIGTQSDLGSLLGGHAICGIGASDKRQAIKLINTWGASSPQVWLPYRTLDKLMAENGEMCIAVDNPKTT